MDSMDPPGPEGPGGEGGEGQQGTRPASAGGKETRPGGSPAHLPGTTAGPRPPVHP